MSQEELEQGTQAASRRSGRPTQLSDVRWALVRGGREWFPSQPESRRQVLVQVGPWIVLASAWLVSRIELGQARP